MKKMIRKAAAAGIAGAVLMTGSAFAADVTLTNVSYDPTRELYAAYNELFESHYLEETK